MPWVMSMLHEPAPAHGGGKSYKFYIGNLPIVTITFRKNGHGHWKCHANYADRLEIHDTMSLALKAMHERLNSPSPEGAVVGFKKKGVHSDEQPPADPPAAAQEGAGPSSSA